MPEAAEAAGAATDTGGNAPVKNNAWDVIGAFAPAIGSVLGALGSNLGNQGKNESSTTTTTKTTPDTKAPDNTIYWVIGISLVLLIAGWAFFVHGKPAKAAV